MRIKAAPLKKRTATFAKLFCARIKRWNAGSPANSKFPQRFSGAKPPQRSRIRFCETPP
jgi:hypothetical protein